MSEAAPAAGLDDRVESALQSFRRGSFAEFEKLLGDDGAAPGLCATLASIVGAAAPVVMTATGRIGPYAVVREIGRGGMAVVYEAVQEQTGQTVALKVVHRGTETLSRLFRREIDSLARLKHPGIATLYDAGHTPDGQHYFAMELVSGISLDRHLASTTARADIALQLRLFAQICRAVSFAHQRGVIHCDLKPSNIIIATDGPPKILDFGLARLLDPDSAHTGITEAGRIMGTLIYMSPEQVRGRRDEIDIRSDVYSLGVILYEWLTGSRPYTVRTREWPEAARTICETPVKRPRLVVPRLRGDVETILLKALQKDAEQRYQSAAALADDIDRYLAGQPILARSPSAVYQVQKFVGRHRLGTATALLVVLLSIGSAVAIAIEASRARAAAQRAERTNEFLVRMIATADPNEAGQSVQVQDLLARASAGLDTELADQPEVRASLHDTIGRSYLGLNRWQDAKRHITASLELRRRLHGARHPAVAASLHQLGRAVWGAGNSAAGTAYVQQPYDMRRELLGENHWDVTESELELARMSDNLGDYAIAEQLARQALATRRRLLGEHRSVAEALGVLARGLVEGGRYAEAEPLLNEALDIQRRLLGPDHFELCLTMKHLGEVYWQRADYGRAEQVYSERVRILRRMFADGHFELADALTDYANLLGGACKTQESETTHREAVAMKRATGRGAADTALNLNDYAVFLRTQGRSAEAEPLCREVYRYWVDQHPETHPARAYACGNLGLTLLELSREAEAEPLLVQAVDCWRKLFGTQNPALAGHLIGLGRVKQSRGEFDKAQQCFEEAINICRTRLGESHFRTAVARIWLAQLRHARGEKGAAAECNAAIATMLKTLKECHPDVVWARKTLAAMSP